MTARYKNIPSKGVYVANATALGYAKHLAQRGDLILYRETYENGHYGKRLARVLDLVTHDHDGKEFRKPTGRGTQSKRAPWLRVLAIDDMAHAAWERWIDPADVLECRAPSPSAFAAWVLGGPLPSTDTVLAAAKHGSLSDSYFDKNAENGALTDNWLAIRLADERKVHQ